MAHSRRYSLCEVCAERQGDQSNFEVARGRSCFVCRGLTSGFPRIGERVARRVQRYQFNTFSIGIVVPSGIQEREDQLRSDLKIRGRETIKSQLGRSVSDFVRKQTGRRVDRMHPDITALVDLDQDAITVSAKSVFVYGKYAKPSGVPQKRELCDRCGGRGCEECESGYKKGISVEEVVGHRLGRVLGSRRAKFTWMGSEDPESAVLPPGRPFVVEFKDPRRREVPPRFVARTGRGTLKVTGLRTLKGRPTSVPSFTFKTRAFIESESQLGRLPRGLSKALTGAEIQFRNNKGKVVGKKVYSFKLKRRVRGLEAEIKLDGGLPVKRLISGGSVSMSLADLLKTPLSCQRFDILRVWESGSFKFGKI